MQTAATTSRSDQIRLLWNIGGETMVPSIFKDFSVMTDVTVNMRGKTQKEKEDREWRIVRRTIWKAVLRIKSGDSGCDLLKAPGLREIRVDLWNKVKLPYFSICRLSLDQGRSHLSFFFPQKSLTLTSPGLTHFGMADSLEMFCRYFYRKSGKLKLQHSLSASKLSSFDLWSRLDFKTWAFSSPWAIGMRPGLHQPSPRLEFSRKTIKKGRRLILSETLRFKMRVTISPSRSRYIWESIYFTLPSEIAKTFIGLSSSPCSTQPPLSKTYKKEWKWLFDVDTSPNRQHLGRWPPKVVVTRRSSFVKSPSKIFPPFLTLPMFLLFIFRLSGF